MKYIEARNYNDLSRKAANILSAQVILKSDAVLGLATGSTPIGTYKQLIEWYEKGDIDFSGVRTVNLDEYVGVTPDDPHSYRYFMNTNLFNHINIKKSNTNVPSGTATNMERECERYNNLISELGGIDMQLLGIGHNGHIGFNEPGQAFEKMTHIVELGESTREANKRFFDSYDAVPRYAITMGIKAIMQARKLVLIANGSDKEEIIKKAIYGPVTPEVPASILQLHPDVTVICCFKD